PEDGAAIIEEIELDIAAAADELFLAFGLAPRLADIVAHQLRVDAQERAPDVLGEGEVGIEMAAIEPIEKDAADAAHLAAVLEEKIFVAPLFVFVVVGDAGMGVAGGLHGGMEGHGVG